MMDSTRDRADNVVADPNPKFGRPLDVLYDDVLDVDAKRHILESWKKDAQLLSTASNENMTGGKPSASTLQEVTIALYKLEQMCGSIN